MGDPLAGRDYLIELGGFSFNQEEATQVTAVRVEQHDVESLNRAVPLQSAQVLREISVRLRRH